jgi:hypothetical protein
MSNPRLLYLQEKATDPWGLTPCSVAFSIFKLYMIYMFSYHNENYRKKLSILYKNEAFQTLPLPALFSLNT